MRRDIHVLLLGFETTNGQTILRRMNENFPTIKVAVPAGIYKEDIIISQYLVPLNLSNVEQLTKTFQLIQTVVICDQKFNNKKVLQAAESAKTKVVNAFYNYPQTVVEAAYHRFSFTPISMTAHQSASGLGLKGIWTVSHQESFLSFPKQNHGKYSIDQKPIDIQKMKVAHRIEFSNKFTAILFWLFALFLRLIFPFGKDRRTFNSNCNWRFFGETVEFDDTFEYEVTAESVESEYLRPDVAVLNILTSLSIKENESCDWNSFSRMRIKLSKYELKK
ncbi:hypothetical protein TRFO_24466 [Tritrichomonas foetus]|uniref:Uncharacterized protein n=1 Tax=Tritrichomonas foetus TaxID=1144522 RepID=A0A1J4K845_9EUKA|nr:hypothetical protein TRFO_24466 [Tritrichomonas foetus]|eukprot:OHT07379.1 hypothetical protein TRFO_24466 [Tritrichomonas foetus]